MTLKKMKNSNLFYFLILSTISIQLSYAVPDEQSKRKPNILIIMADDMGYSDLGCYGGEAHTPNIDRLAKNGLRFRTFYNAARCCPSRASLLTGVYPHEAGMGGMVSAVGSQPKAGPYQGFLNNNTITIAEALKLAGYKTYMSGKWHVGEEAEHWPRKRGFGRYFGLISGASSYFELVKEPRVRQMAHDDKPWTPPADGFYMTDAISDTAVNFIEQHGQTKAEQPFFLYLAYTAPHWPLHALEPDIKRYDGVYDSGWDQLRQHRFERMQQLGIIDSQHQLSLRTANIPAWDKVSNQKEWANRMEVYAAMIDRMDQGVGRVLSALERQGQLENTLIVFLSDNGGCAENVDGRKLNKEGTRVGQRGSYVAYDEPWANVSNTPYRKYKSWTHEGGIITPCIVYWPKGMKRSGKFTNAVGDIKDIMATCLDLAGMDYPQTYKGHELVRPEGKSWLPLFNQEIVEKRTLFWEHQGKKAARSGNWKLVSGGNQQPWELYDLAKDPEELKDISKQYPKVVAQLKDKYVDWATKVGVK